jgi:hypothetical protein
VLFEHGIQIVGSRVVTQSDAVSARFELATESGGPIPKERGLALQTAVLSTVTFAGRTMREPPGAEDAPRPACVAVLEKHADRIAECGKKSHLGSNGGRS